MVGNLPEDSNFMASFEAVAAIMKACPEIVFIYFSYLCKDLHMTEYG